MDQETGKTYISIETATAQIAFDALNEAHRYFLNRPGNWEEELTEMIGQALSIARAEGILKQAAPWVE